MKTFELVIQDSRRRRTYANVRSFVGADASGSFGILAGHARMTTALVVGLARFLDASEVWQYVAMPGAILYFADERLTLTARRCFVGNDYKEISAALQRRMLAEEQALAKIKTSLHRLEEEMLRRLWALDRELRA